MRLLKNIFSLFQGHSPQPAVCADAAIPTKPKHKHGYAMLIILAVVSITLTFIVGLAVSVVNENWFATQARHSEQAFQIAEAGINYYLWFLNHNENDWQDGQGIAGPYTHEFDDGQGNTIGQFVLDIEPPTGGSTIGIIRSTGILHTPDAPRRTIEAKIGVPSLAKYAFITNADVWFGEDESVDGRLHSNGGIRFDGTTNDLVTSAVEEYACQAYHGCSGENHPGVWGSGGPASFWEYGVPEVDFDQVSADLSTLQTAAGTAQGLSLPTTTGSYQGYNLVLSSNGTATPTDDRITVSRVKKTDKYWGYTSEEGNIQYADVINEQVAYNTYNVPANGIVYVDDNIWVSGTTSNRLTIVAAHLPEDSSKYRSIVVNGNLKYYAKDGTAVVGLIAQKDIRLAYNSLDTIEIHAVMLAQKGKVIRPHYIGSVKTTITTYGGVISNLIWIWTWVSGGGSVISGYKNTNSTYDPHLIYNPPPKYPTTGTYEVLNWQEILAQF